VDFRSEERGGKTKVLPVLFWTQVQGGRYTGKKSVRPLDKRERGEGARSARTGKKKKGRGKTRQLLASDTA